MTNQPRFGFVLEYVDDVVAAKSFYVDVLGLRVERESPEFVQFVDPAGVNFAIASDESLTGSRDREVYWVVDNPGAMYETLAGSVDITLPLKHAPFGQVFGVKAPSGQTQYLVKFAEDRPSTVVGKPPRLALGVHTCVRRLRRGVETSIRSSGGGRR